SAATASSILPHRSFCPLPLRPPPPPLFPYTTLFRSQQSGGVLDFLASHASHRFVDQQHPRVLHQQHADFQPLLLAMGQGACVLRSEEHTSELQSRENLVCRLLLEKKKKASTQPERRS